MAFLERLPKSKTTSSIWLRNLLSPHSYGGDGGGSNNRCHCRSRLCAFDLVSVVVVVCSHWSWHWNPCTNTNNETTRRKGWEMGGLAEREGHFIRISFEKMGFMGSNNVVVLLLSYTKQNSSCLVDHDFGYINTRSPPNTQNVSLLRAQYKPKRYNAI